MDNFQWGKIISLSWTALNQQQFCAEGGAKVWVGLCLWGLMTRTTIDMLCLNVQSFCFQIVSSELSFLCYFQATEIIYYQSYGLFKYYNNFKTINKDQTHQWQFIKTWLWASRRCRSQKTKWDRGLNGPQSAYQPKECSSLCREEAGWEIATLFSVHHNRTHISQSSLRYCGPTASFRKIIELLNFLIWVV